MMESIEDTEQVTGNSQEDLIRLLRRQNFLLGKINTHLEELSSKIEDDRRTAQTLKMPIILSGLDISISNLMTFLFKWLFASIPVAIIIGILYLLLVALLGLLFR